MRALALREKAFLRSLIIGARLPTATREEDKARQFCRKHGLAEVVMNPRRWVITDAGRKEMEVGE
jgi:hypothetical protein